MARKRNNNIRGSSGTLPRPGVSSNNLGIAGRAVQLSTRRMVTPTTGGVRIKNTEYMGGINGSTTTRNKYIFPIGLTFSDTPWLERLAWSYSRFKVHSCRAFFVGTAPSTINGGVTIGFFPDPVDAAEWIASSNYNDIWQSTKVVSGHPFNGVGLNASNPISLGLASTEMHNSLPWFYIGSSMDPRNCSAGVFAVQSEITSVAGGLGNMFIEYDIELTQPTPHLENNRVSSLSLVNFGVQATTTDPDNTVPTAPPPDAPGASTASEEESEN